MSAVTKGLDPKALAIQLGYTGIIIAAVARLNPLGVVPVAMFLAAITVSGSSLQSIGVPVELVVLLQGLIFLSVTAGEFFVANRVRLAPRVGVSSATDPRGGPQCRGRRGAGGGCGMNDTVVVLSAVSAIVAGTPILLAALGEIIAERSGVMNLGVEGMMLLGAVVGFWTGVHTGSLTLSLLAGGAGRRAAGLRPRGCWRCRCASTRPCRGCRS